MSTSFRTRLIWWIAAAMAVAISLVVPQAARAGLFDWLCPSSQGPQAGTATTYTPAVGGQPIAVAPRYNALPWRQQPGAAAVAGAPATLTPTQAVAYVPHTYYVQVKAPVAYTACQLVAGYDPCTGCPVTMYRPITAVSYQTRYVAQTTVRPVAINLAPSAGALRTLPATLPATTSTMPANALPGPSAGGGMAAPALPAGTPTPAGTFNQATPGAGTMSPGPAGAGAATAGPTGSGLTLPSETGAAGGTTTQYRAQRPIDTPSTAREPSAASAAAKDAAGASGGPSNSPSPSDKPASKPADKTPTGAAASGATAPNAAASGATASGAAASGKSPAAVPSRVVVPRPSPWNVPGLGVPVYPKPKPQGRLAPTPASPEPSAQPAPPAPTPTKPTGGTPGSSSGGSAGATLGAPSFSSNNTAGPSLLAPILRPASNRVESPAATPASGGLKPAATDGWSGGE